MLKLILALALAAPLLSACEKPVPKPPKPIASALIAPNSGSALSFGHA
jgi:hypothetical protein